MFLAVILEPFVLKTVGRNIFSFGHYYLVMGVLVLASKCGSWYR